MSGFAGLSPAKKRRQETFVLRKPSLNLKAECAGHVAGLAVSIVEEDVRIGL